MGCAGVSSPHIIPPVQGSVAISSPATGATLKSLPVTVQVTLSGGAKLSNTTVTVNGQDVTNNLTSGQNGVSQATLGAPTIYIGTNRIQAQTGSQIVKSLFTFDPTTAEYVSAELPTLNANGAAVPDVVPIQTRIQVPTSSGNAWAVQVGATQYVQQSAGQITDGYQVVLLRRSDLSLISNNVYDLSQPNKLEFLMFIQAIMPQAQMKNACGVGGCVEIIQNLNTSGLLPCNSSSPLQLIDLCGTWQQAFAAIGATNAINSGTYLDTNNLGYSFVGNISDQTLHEGANYERVTCSSSTGCIEDSPPSQQQQIAGQTPNGYDGVLATLASTGAAGTTQVPASGQMPAMTVSNNGAIAGEFILDNNDYYTFRYPDPPIHFAMGIDPNDNGKALIELRAPAKGPFRFPGGATVQTGSSAALPTGAKGGFLLTAFDATTFQNLANGTFVVDPALCGQTSCTSPDGTEIFPMSQLAPQIASLNSRRAVVFLQSIGDIRHSCPQGQQCEANNTHQGGLPIQDIWDQAAQAVQDIGGTFATFVSLSNSAYGQDSFDQYTPNTIPQDDYYLVGQWWSNASNVPNPYAQEESSQINRQTIAEGAGSRMTGLLEKENDGYYRATLESEYGEFFPKTSVSFFTAPLLQPVNWPLTGPSDPPGLAAAYQWISQQLLGCISQCTDIRSAYYNLNQDPAIWFAQLTSLQSPSDCVDGSCGIGFTGAEFETAKAQVLNETRYLASLREYQNNLLTLLGAEQTNQGIILQQELDSILANTTINLTTTTVKSQNWRNWAQDGLKVLGAGESFGGKIGVPAAIGAGLIATDGIVAVGAPYALPVAALASAIGMGVIDLTAKSTNDINGRSLQEQEHELVAGSGLAGKMADQYTDILTTVGHDFRRIASDWGRLSAIGTTLTQNGLTWDSSATGNMLGAFDLAARRQLVTGLLPSGYTINHYTYGSPGVNPGFGLVFLPQAQYGSYPSQACDNYDFMNFQKAGNPSDPGTRQTAASYLYVPAAPIDGPGVPLAQTKNHYPFDLWWDLWTISESQFPLGKCANTSVSPTNNLFLNTGMFTPIEPGNPSALGLYKVWLFQRNFQSSISRPLDPGTQSSFWNSQLQGDQSIQVPTFNLPNPSQPDPDSY